MIDYYFFGTYGAIAFQSAVLILILPGRGQACHFHVGIA
jgi:hypothetical protein